MDEPINVLYISDSSRTSKMLDIGLIGQLTLKTGAKIKQVCELGSALTELKKIGDANCIVILRFHNDSEGLKFFKDLEKFNIISDKIKKFIITCQPDNIPVESGVISVDINTGFKGLCEQVKSYIGIENSAKMRL